MITVQEWNEIKAVIERRATRVIPSLRPGYDSASGLTLGDNGIVLKTGTAASGAPIGCWVLLDRTQAIGNGAAADGKLSFDTSIYDSSTFWSIGTPDTFTIPVAGAYHVVYSVEWDVDATGYRESFFQHNAFDAAFSRQEAQMVIPAAPTDDARGTVVTAGTVIQASAGDTLFLAVQQSSGGDLDVIEPSLRIQYVGAKIG